MTVVMAEERASMDGGGSEPGWVGVEREMGGWVCVALAPSSALQKFLI